MIIIESIFIAVIALIVWYFALRSLKKRSMTRISAKLRHDYFLGLNHLINEQPDKAVDVFIKLLKVDSDTIETHLALGSLFRRRGEIERAIRIHQNLIARPYLDQKSKVTALSELGRDYLKAGILGRAEKIFLELTEVGEMNLSSLRHLLHIYQQEKDWEKAIQIARKLESIAGESMALEISHYYCELAIQVYKHKKVKEAKQYLNRAYTSYYASVRTSLLFGQIEMEQGNYKEAIYYYKRAYEQDSAYLSETINPLIFCYQQLEKEEAMVTYFKKCLNDYPRVSLILALSQYLQKKYSDQSAIEFIAQQLHKYPSLRGLKRLVEIYLASTGAEVKSKLIILNDLIDHLLEKRPLYRCTQCGFSTKIIHWLCPGCFAWSSVKPIQGLEEN